MIAKRIDLKKQIQFVLHTMVFFYKIAFKLRPSYFVYVSLLIIINTVFPFITIIVPKLMIDELMTGRNVSQIGIFVAVIIVSNSLNEILKKAFVENQNRIADSFERHFEMQLGYRAMEMDFEYTEDPKILDQCRKAENGMRNSSGIQGITSNFIAIVSSFFVLVGVISLVINSSPLLILFLVINIIVSMLINKKINEVEIKYFSKNVDTNRAFDYVCNELPNFRLGKDIRLYDAEPMMLMKENNLSHILVDKEKNLSSELLPFSQKNILVNALRETLTFLYLGYQAIKGIITIGTFTMLLQASITFSNALSGIILNVLEIHKNLTFMNEYILFMDIKDKLTKGNKKVEMTDEYSIEFKNVSFRYPNSSKDVLKKINITIHPKEHLSIVGQNGSGKTTFIKLLCRLYDVTEGEILLNGINIKEYDYEDYRQMLSVVFQDFKLLSFSLKDNILLKEITQEEMTLEQELLQLCEVCGLGEKVQSLGKGVDTSIYKQFDSEGFEPSGGEAQKLAIVRALYKRAPILILDEPTAALDPIAEYEIYNHFDKLVGGKTAVYISHRLSSCKFCDKIAVFSEGTIEEYGTHDELIKRAQGVYYIMFQAQAQYYQ